LLQESIKLIGMESLVAVGSQRMQIVAVRI